MKKIHYGIIPVEHVNTDTPQDVSATVVFTHGRVQLVGTPIFVLAQISTMEKLDGWVSTDRGESLIAVLRMAANRRQNVVTQDQWFPPDMGPLGI